MDANAISTATEKLTGKNHEIRVGLLPREGDINKIVCASYYDGTVIFGKNAVDMPHPETRISFSGQNTILWIGNFPFSVEIQTEVPERLFYRMPTWQSVEGKDQLHRVQTGALNPERVGEVSPEFHLKYSIHKRLDAGSIAPDPHCESLDPHIIVEP